MDVTEPANSPDPATSDPRPAAAEPDASKGAAGNGPEPETNGDAGPSPRARALAVLAAVLHHGKALDEAMKTAETPPDLSQRDRAFIRMLIATTLRRLGQIDDLIGGCLEKPLPAGASGVTDILRLGVAQLLFMDTPAHAAVDESVTLADTHSSRRYKNLVNAILRRLSSEGATRIAAQDAAQLNTPDWLWRVWSAAYGEDTCRAFAAEHMDEPPLDLTVPVDREAWAERLEGELLPTGSVRRTGGGLVTDLPGFAEGAWWVQDAAAALPARLLGDVSGLSVVDLCAAPGGKTAQLAAAGARVTAVDRSPSRVNRLRENMERLKLDIEIVTADATMWRPPAQADAVLLDAPCSATGTLRRHPDIAWTKQPGDVKRLASAQDRLLAAAADMVRPGGLLVFCTCSLQPEEGAQRVNRLVSGGARMVRDPINAEELFGLRELLTPEGELRTHPGLIAEKGGMDGFYAARLRRV